VLDKHVPEAAENDQRQDLLQELSVRSEHEKALTAQRLGRSEIPSLTRYG
jgi:hypothetical protein